MEVKQEGENLWVLRNRFGEVMFKSRSEKSVRATMDQIERQGRALREREARKRERPGGGGKPGEGE